MPDSSNPPNMITKIAIGAGLSIAGVSATLPATDPAIIWGFSMPELQAIGIIGGLAFAGVTAISGVLFNWIRLQDELRRNNKSNKKDDRDEI